MGFSGVTSGKNNVLSKAGDVRDSDSIPESRRIPGGVMAAHSSILAWRIPWAEDPGRLQSGSQRIGHN